MRPLPFNALIADLEKIMGRVKRGRVSLDGEGCTPWHMVLWAEEEGEMRSMMERLEEYLEGKGLD